MSKPAYCFPFGREGRPSPLQGLVLDILYTPEVASQLMGLLRRMTAYLLKVIVITGSKKVDQPLRSILSI